VTETQAPAIPAEILQAAEAVHLSILGRGISASVDFIARALMDRDERAAKIAEGNAKSFDFQQALADCDDFVAGFNSARLSIAAAIRAGE
jgi:hypothetical protein